MKVSRTAMLSTALAGGAAAFCLRLLIYRNDLDPDGLLAPSALQGALVAVSLAVLAALALLSRGSRFSKEYKHLYPASGLAAAGLGVSAVLLAVGCAGALLHTAGPADTAIALLGLIAAACLADTARKRKKGHVPYFLFQGLVCLFYLVTLMYEFHLRGHDPQLLDYVFQILAWLCLMVASFQRTCLDIQPGQLRTLAFVNACAVFFSLTALSAGEDVPLHLSGLLWAVLNQPREDRP